MKLKNIINTLSLAAVALVATGCQDTDAQVNIAEAFAPELVSVTPATTDVVLYGEKTFKVKFNERVFFATKNTSLITLNGVPVKKASVIGADSVLTIVADVDFKKIQTLNIPAGLILGPQKTPLDQELSFTWTINELPSNDATAMTKKLGWGWNLGNHFDTSDTQWGYWDGATPTAATFQTIANAGGRTVRVPVTWTNHMDDNHTINAAYLNEVKGVVDLAINAGLNVILNTHHDSFETDLGNAAANDSIARVDSALIATLWTQVATKFAGYGDNLIFETFNEVHAGDNWNAGSEAENNLLNLWNQYAVKAIRSVAGNETRWIAISHYAANIDQTIAHLVLPENDNRIIVGVHCYDPYNFCLHPMNDDGSVLANSWGHNADPNTSVSGANEEYIIAQLYKLRTAYIEKGIPCYLGEYGCVWQTTDLANKFRAYYLEFFCRAAYLAGIPMFVWDNNAKNSGNEANGYIDHATGAWLNDSETVVPAMIKACTSTDESYWFDAIWAKSPAGN
jgi:endoglucanase